jgi:phage-related protein
MFTGDKTFEVLFFKDKRGIILAQEYIDELPEDHQGKVLKGIHLLQEKGHMLRRPWADFLRDKIYELRPTYAPFEHRILYFFVGRSIVLTHGFLKKTQRTPPGEIDFAIKCRAEWLTQSLKLKK